MPEWTIVQPAHGLRFGTLRYPAAMVGSPPGDAPVESLLNALGIDVASYRNFLAWALAEQLVAVIAQAVAADEDHQATPLWNRRDGRRRFRQIIRSTTGRSWSVDDEERLFERVQMASEKHYRDRIEADELVRLLWNQPHICVKCGRQPPEVTLHVDHVFPASRGGTSKVDNLQFLCAACNQRKSNKIEQEGLWLSSV